MVNKILAGLFAALAVVSLLFACVFHTLWHAIFALVAIRFSWVIYNADKDEEDEQW